VSIANFVAASIDELRAHRYDVAMSLACSAVDGTTAKTSSQSEMSNNKRFKAFLEENMRLITRHGFPGIEAGGIRIKCINIPDLATDQKGYVSIADIIYHVVRCSVIHECSIDERIEFTEQTYIGDFQAKFKIPRRLIIGLLAAVVQSPKNSDELFEKDILATILTAMPYTKTIIT
jgi:hypothetical protein